MEKIVKKNKVRLGVVGLSRRGKSLMKSLLNMEDVVIPAVCDLFEDRVAEGVQIVTEAGQGKPAGYTDYRELLARNDIDGVIIPASWNSHMEIAIAAMKAGIYAAPEVGGAYSLQECWELARTSEVTGVPCMMLENCCYGREEMALLNITKKGLLGELVHCQAGYEHDLRQEVAMGIENRHYRIHNYLNRNGDIYPTHGIGPLAKILGINRGNRFISLTSMSSKARGLNEWAAAHLGQDHVFASTHFAQGDIVTTMIKCAHGETVLLTHDTTLPRPYSRGGRVQGTKGIWMEDNQSIYIEGRSPEHVWEPFAKFKEEHEHPLWKEYLASGIIGGHGGMDYLTLRAFVESVQNQYRTPIDAYDTAVWMAITELSEQSIALGSQPVAFPDFTNGKWINRQSEPCGKYSLDEIDYSLF